jgi:predicted nucleic acid-binding protein
MRGAVIIDAGPLVAMLDDDDQHHAWAKQQVAELNPPLLTCEAVVTEAAFLVRHVPNGVQHLLEFLQRGTVQPVFRLTEEVEAVTGLIAKYADLPMSLADACLVRMAELHQRSRVFTLDRHFRINRMHGRKSVPVIMP